MSTAALGADTRLVLLAALILGVWKYWQMATFEDRHASSWSP